MTPDPNPTGLYRFLMGSAAFVIIVAGLKAASTILVPFLLSVFIAILFTPPFVWSQRKGIPTSISLLVVLLGLIMVSFAGTAVVGNAVSTYSRSLPYYQERIQSEIGDAMNWLEAKGIEPPREAVQDVINTKNALRFVGTTMSALSSLLSNTFFIILVAIFMLLEAAILPRKVQNLSGMNEANWKRLLRIVDQVRQYMGLKSLTSLFTGILVWALAAVLQIDYAIMLGLLAFILNYVPNVGSILAAVPGVVLALIQYGGAKAGIVAAGYLVINILIGSILEPRIMGKGMGLSPMVIVLSLIFWGWVLGPVGMLLSVPLTMTIVIILESGKKTRGWAQVMGSGETAKEA